MPAGPYTERWPWRMIVRGAFLDGWARASDEERQQVFVRWIEAHKRWQEAGCRLVATLDDETSMAGQPGARMWNFYTIWELPDPRIVYDLLKVLRVEDERGMRFDRYFRFETVVCKPIIGFEQGLGGLQKARTPGIDWES
jgi:hypothetical protein